MHKVDAYILRFGQIAKDDIKAYKKSSDFTSLKTLWDLIDDIKINGEMIGKGNPERLRRDLKGYCSRQINDIDRLVYRIFGNTIEITSCRGHYNDN